MCRFLVLLSLLLLTAPSVQAFDRSGAMPSYDAATEEVVATYPAPDGSGLAWVVRASGSDRLLVDGEVIATEETIGQIHLSPGGEPVFWHTRRGREFVVYRGQAGPGFDRVYMPDLRVLIAQGHPQPGEWGYLGGTRVAFGALDKSGDWTALLRFPGAWQNQESRPLPLTRAVATSPDPSSRSHEPLHFGLLKEKIPVYIGQQEDEECLVIGRSIAACGRQVAMLAMAPDASQLAFALATPQGLEVHSSFGVSGPTPNVDWISFSPDGRHLAYVMKQAHQQTLVVDGQLSSTHEMVSAVAWSGDGRLVALVHEETGSRILVDGQTLLEKPFIERLFMAPDGRVLAAGKESNGPFLDPYGRPGGFTSMWSEGFLASGPFFGLVRLPDSNVAVLLDGALSEAYSGMNRLATAPDGSHLVAVGASVDGDAVLMDGAPWQTLDGRAQRFTWCGGEHLQVMEVGANLQCLVSAGREKACCDRIVAAGCQSDGQPVYVCLEKSLFVAHLGDGSVIGPFDDVPQHLLYQDQATGQLQFAARGPEGWILVLDGVAIALRGQPVQVLPSSDEAWTLEQAEMGMRWITPSGSTEWFDSLSAPVQYGAHSLVRGRLNGKECLATPKRTYPWHDAIVSPLYPVGNGGFYWAVDGGKVQLQTLEF